MLALTGFKMVGDTNDNGFGQPIDERDAQNALPQAKDSLWAEFSKCKITSKEDKKNDVYLYGINYTPEIQAIRGKEIEISGFMLPLEPTEKFKHFILSKRTPTCAFCPPGKPNEIVDVWTDEPVKWDDHLVKVKGKFEFVNDQKLGMFFQIRNAKIE